MAWKICYTQFPLSEEAFLSHYEKHTVGEDYHALLESGQSGRYHIALWSPLLRGVGSLQSLVVQNFYSKEQKELVGDPLSLFEQELKNFPVTIPADYPVPFSGGAVGYVTYDYARCIEKLPNIAISDRDIPIMEWTVYAEWAVWDKETSMVTKAKLLDEEAAEVVEKWAEDIGSAFNHSFQDVIGEITSKLEAVSMEESAFNEAVERIQAYIRSGDVFQVNLSVRQMKTLSVSPFEVYKVVRRINPSPYMSYIKTPERDIVSGSPELLVKKQGDTLSTRPIAGTRSRGKTPEEEIQLEKALRSNTKEAAEHLMLVDLERNDLGKVAKYGTVEVDEFMTIEKYSHVMHLVSSVTAKVREGESLTSIIRAVFPGGTITGTPKVRTMEIIEELEPVRRGLYTGSIGWMGFTGDMELNIVIRTMVVENGCAFVQAGAGVVIDSIPAFEYKESLKKAKAMWVAKDMAERGSTT